MEVSERPLYSSVEFRHRSDSSYAAKYGYKAHKPAQIYSNYQNRWNTVQELEFGTKLEDMEESDSCSPPLWTTSPSRISEYENTNHRSLSPTSRKQAIIRGQQELMEMVKNMGESDYELTLRDLVEAQQKTESEERNISKEPENSYKMKDDISTHKQVNHKAALTRSSGRIDSGDLYIKMAIPTYLRWSKTMKKKKSSRRSHDQSSTDNMNSEVSTKPSVSSKGSKKFVNAECWNKSFSVSGSSESDASTINGRSTSSNSNSGSSSIKSNSRHGFGGCWCFIRKSRNQVQNDS